MKLLHKYPWRFVSVATVGIVVSGPLGFKIELEMFLMSLFLLVSSLTGIVSTMKMYLSYRTNEWVLDGYGKIWGTVIFLSTILAILHYLYNYEWWITVVIVTGFTLEYFHYSIAWYKTTFNQED